MDAGRRARAARLEAPDLRALRGGSRPAEPARGVGALARGAGRALPDAPAVAGAERGAGGVRGRAVLRVRPRLPCARARSSRRRREATQVGSSGEEPIAFERIARARFELLGEERVLELYWLVAYGGGLFVPFRDETSGRRDLRRRPLPARHGEGRRPRRRGRAARARLQLRLQPVVQLRPALGLPALAAGEPAAGARSRQAGGCRTLEAGGGTRTHGPLLYKRCSAS